MSGFRDFDVAVVGGGPAGISAAVAAGRMGTRTVLIERHDVLGGMGTAGLVNIFCNAHFDGQRLIIGGVFGELRRRLIARGRLFAPLALHKGEPYDPVACDEESAALCREAGVEVLLQASVREARFGEDSRAAAFLLRDERRVNARYVVDATGDAQIAADAGVPFAFGRCEDGAVMPLTYCFLAGPVDIETVRREIPDGVRHDKNTGVDYIYAGNAFTTAKIRAAKARGEWDIPRDNGAIFSVPGSVETVSVNLTRVFIDDPTDPEQLARADAEGWTQVAQCLRFFRASLPGFERAELVAMARQIGVRESRRIEGLYELTAQDAVSCRQFPDVIAQCCYGLDDHKPGSQTWVMDHHFALGEHYDIPLRCLIPRAGPSSLIVTGRAISAERAAMSSFRVQPSCMALGEAAGVTAAWAVRNDCAIGDVSPACVQAHLRENGGILA